MNKLWRPFLLEAVLPAAVIMAFIILINYGIDIVVLMGAVVGYELAAIEPTKKSAFPVLNKINYWYDSSPVIYRLVGGLLLALVVMMPIKPVICAIIATTVLLYRELGRH